MEKIALSKTAKAVYRNIKNGDYECTGTMFRRDFSRGARELQMHGLVRCHEEENGEVGHAYLTEQGRYYISRYPKLRNPLPVDWKALTVISLNLITVAACMAAIIIRLS